MPLRGLLRGRRSTPPPPGYDAVNPRGSPAKEVVERDGTTFHCQSRESADGAWRVAYGQAADESTSRVFLMHDGELIHERQADRPLDAFVATDGTSLVLEGGTFEQLGGRAVVIDDDGHDRIAEAFPVNVMDGEIADDGDWAAVVTQPPSPGVHVIDVQGERTTTIEEPNRETVRVLGFAREGERSIVYLSRNDREEPYVALAMNGEVAWRSERYRDTESLFRRVRGWFGSGPDSTG